MDRQFYKSLDRELEIFGLRGSWVKVFLLAAGCGLVLGLVSGSLFGTGIGLSAVIVCVVCGFFGCLALQSRIPSRQLGKQKLSDRSECWVIRRETLSRILLEQRSYEESRRILREMKR